MVSIITKKHFDPKKQLEKALQASIVNISEDIRKQAKYEAPVDTGFLKASIKNRIDRLRAAITVWASYGGYVEFGTMYQKANPYFRRAIDIVKVKIPSILGKNIRRYMK